ncbi:Phosphotransferase system, phosphocarrier protein HPr [Bifidobacterium minimum]|jgi:phosphocarrier protein|uniref:Phosphocarrier protein HPr n=1 Tax=Bifidobacterium minimum TaxID=1693 RepID=A0A087BRC6_9BIFI|nr:HPr family phosphocarrier protein [Bifidobacterium minimum]KFI73576.1 Phosphotransferase system, phosphocarrier protein HPr [Bifidobacterium minimum]MCH4159459.1 HPr family phosphocarrier protein [Bifidobacterium minimum]
MSTATRTTVINDPVGIHARPAAEFSQAVTASGCTVTISKKPGTPGVNASSILSVMGLGVKAGDTIEIIVNGDDAETVADSLIATLTKGE